jgi:hypothetical protein
MLEPGATGVNAGFLACAEETRVAATVATTAPAIVPMDCRHS